MLPEKPVTLKEIATQAGVSVMTVSRALRNHPNISPATQQRVKAIAERLGYRPNPLVSALMTYRRAARPVRADLALGFLTDFPTHDGWRRVKLYKEIFEGAQTSADRHGFHLEEFWLREPGMTDARMSQILYTRNVGGAIIAPLPMAQGELKLDWDKLSAVTIGYSLTGPLLHRAVNHQFRSMRLALRQLRRLGYRRIGLALPASINDRVDHQWVGSFLGEQVDYPPADRVPYLALPDPEWNVANFGRWFREHRPDAIVTQSDELFDWIKELGRRVPDDVGIAHLNCSDTSGRVAGIYQNGPTVGAVAVEFLVGMVLRCERGVPALAHSVLVEGTWVSGATLRAPGK